MLCLRRFWPLGPGKCKRGFSKMSQTGFLDVEDGERGFEGYMEVLQVDD